MEAATVALSFDANKSIFSFFAEMYLFSDRVTYNIAKMLAIEQTRCLLRSQLFGRALARLT